MAEPAGFRIPDVLRTRKIYSDKKIFSGLEWNVPGHEHCSTGILAKDASAISAFEYQFDKSDTDSSRDGETTPYGKLIKMNGSTKNASNLYATKKASGEERHADSVAAAAWMEKQYKAGLIDNGWIIFAHIERAGAFKTGSSDGGYNVEDFRDFNNAAPNMCFGFEGAPGHQVNTFRGLGNTVTCSAGVCTSADFGGTYGGVGYYSAKVGGLWDALLGEGRRWFNFANSDYHLHYTAGGDDFYPGEYQKTYVFTKNAYGKDPSLDKIADGLRSGNSFFVHGDLINKLEFSARSGWQDAEMGGELSLNSKSSGPLSLTIKFKSPKFNERGQAPAVDHIDLIAGDITGMIDPSSPDYTKATNESAKVVKTFTASDWYVDQNGYNVVSYRIPQLDKSMYFRLRGTNLKPNTPNETDALGNPLPDALVTLSDSSYTADDAASAAWSDLWFYSNPIFVYVK